MTIPLPRCACAVLLALIGCTATPQSDSAEPSAEVGSTDPREAEEVLVESPPAARLPSLPGVAALRPMVQSADAVFVGRVLSTDFRMSAPDSTGQSLPFTFVTWEVEQGLKGVVSGQRYTARLIGGEMPDGRAMVVSNVPTFVRGDRDLVLLNDNDWEGCPLVEGDRGRVRISEDGTQVRPSWARSKGLQHVELRQRWAQETLDSLRAEGLGAGRSALSKDPQSSFSFEVPRAI
jgi:hypothetical protein